MSDMMNFAFLVKSPIPSNGLKVAIVGAGPCGLAVTGFLVSQGYQIDVFDKLAKPGGLMVFGIPSHRILASRIQRGVTHLERTFGVTFRTNTKVISSALLYEEEGDHFTYSTVTLSELVAEYDAVMIATGSWKSKKLKIPGANLKNIYSSLEFLFPIRAVRYAASNVIVPEVKNKDIVIIGAGHSAIDAAYSAKYLGANSVNIVYRRTIKEAPCGKYEIDRFIENGNTWLELRKPIQFLGLDIVTGLEVLNTKTEKKEIIKADVVVTAIGEIPTPPFARELGLENVRKGEVRWLNMTNIDNVFVAGDVLTGPTKIGTAIYSGLRAAKSLDHWLKLKQAKRQQEYDIDGDRISLGRDNNGK